MTSFVLKLIAAVSMLCDHAGLILFPSVPILRLIGRLAFPIYAFCIAEGFRYTRNRLRYFLRVFVLGALCQIVYFIAEDDVYLGILITFSFSIVLMALTDCVKRAFRGERSPLAALWERLTGKPLSNSADRILSLSLSAAAVLLLLLLTSRITVDYGFFGILLPVCANLFEDRWMRLVSFACCLAAVAFSYGSSFPVQYWSLLALPLLALYNGQPGRVRMKYFFYIFYPAHMAILYGISMLAHR